MTQLVVTAVALERDAIAAGLGAAPTAVAIGPYEALQVGDVVVVAGGVGPAAAAAAAATACALDSYDALLSMGIAGSFPSARLAHGDVVVASSIVAADLGAQSPERFLDLSALGLDNGAVVDCPRDAVAQLRDQLHAAGLHVAVGPVLTLSTMTGTAERAAELMGLHGAVAEAMEGAGVAHVAVLHGLPVFEVRTVSNEVGDRDRATWDLGGALRALTVVAPLVLRAVP